MTPPINIGWHQPELLGELAFLDWSAGRPAVWGRAWSAADFARAAHAPDVLVPVAYALGRPVGYAVVSSAGEASCAGGAATATFGLCVDRLVVAEGWRRRGVASLLLDHLECFALSRGPLEAPAGALEWRATVPEGARDLLEFFAAALRSGFQTGGVARGAFDRPTDDGTHFEDAVLFLRRKAWPPLPA